jgi:stage II sporulation protein D
VEEVTLADYLWGVVAAEMPASFQMEALKAQTVAARTYCLYQSAAGGDKHPGADVCTDSTCCQAYRTADQATAVWGTEAQRYSDKIRQAVADTDGLLCLYDGAPIDAVFFSSSAGKTSDAAAVWGAEVPYLASVDSPEGTEVPGWQTVVTFTPAEFAATFQKTYPEAQFSADPATWVTDLETDDTGLVQRVTIGGVTVTGGEARTLFGLRSAHFTVSSAANAVTLWVTGYGHGVGMSQYGANALAGEGKTFREILTWYYTGATVGTWEG